MSPQSHAISPEVLPEFMPEPAILYGNGLLLCSVGHDHGVNTSPLRSTILSSAQVTSLVSAVVKTGVFNAPSVTNLNDFTGGTGEESVAINFLSGAKKTAYFSGVKPTALQKAEDVITSKCASVHTPYDPEGVVLISKKVNSASSVLPSSDGAGLELADTTEQKGVELHGLQAKLAKSKFGAHSKVSIASGDAPVEAVLQPILPSATPISYHQPAGTAVAASYEPSSWYWFSASNQTQYTGASEYYTIGKSIESFYSAQVAGKVASGGYGGGLKGNLTVAYYQACHVSTNCGSADYNAWVNVYNELRSRGIVSATASVNILSQIPSSYGSNYCSGFGGWSGAAGSNSEAQANRGFAISLGFGVSGAGCEASTGKYFIPAHEYGHTLGLAHTCGETGSLMESCNMPAYNSAWTSYFHINSGQKSNLNAYSLGLNQRIQGRVYNGSTGSGISSASVYTCNFGTIKTDASGYFDLRVGTKASVCLRVTAGAPSGYHATTNNNTENATASTYEYQVAGYNCYHNTACSSSQQIWDRSVDNNYNFRFIP